MQEDESGINPVIKIWNLDKRDVHGSPVCVHLVRALPGNRPVPVTAFTIDEQMHLMAAGFSDGSIVLYRGKIYFYWQKVINKILFTVGHFQGTSVETVTANRNLYSQEQVQFLVFHYGQCRKLHNCLWRHQVLFLPTLLYQKIKKSSSLSIRLAALQAVLFLEIQN